MDAHDAIALLQSFVMHRNFISTLRRPCRKCFKGLALLRRSLSGPTRSSKYHIQLCIIMRKISVQRRKDIIQKLKNGISHRQISQQYCVAIGTVSNIRKTLLAALPKPKLGRPKKMQFHHHHFLEREFKCRTFKTVQKACKTFKERFNTGIFRTTMWIELIKMQYRARVIVKKTFTHEETQEELLALRTELQGLDHR